MYSESDIEAAVAAGALSGDQAARFRSFVATSQSTSLVDEEHFRLVTGFNDIFVAIASVILLIAVGWIGQAIWPGAPEYPTPLGGLFVAGTAWGLAEYFTRARRMALPSIILLLAFVGGVFMTGFGTVAALIDAPPNTPDNDALIAVDIGMSALVTAGASWLHWRRFMVPITIAAGAGAIAGMVIALVVAALPDPDNARTLILWLVLFAGLCVFGFAMRWDMSDPLRETRRSDVAFWLHLLSAPMIAHPLFSLLGLTDDSTLGVGGAIGAVALYIAFGLVALAIDRRAMLVSALAYVLIALTMLFRTAGVIELNVALTALVIGSALLLLSAFWHAARRAVVTPLPEGISARLPMIERRVAA